MRRLRSDSDTSSDHLEERSSSVHTPEHIHDEWDEHRHIDRSERLDSRGRDEYHEKSDSRRWGRNSQGNYRERDNWMRPNCPEKPYDDYDYNRLVKT